MLAWNTCDVGIMSLSLAIPITPVHAIDIVSVLHILDGMYLPNTSVDRVYSGNKVLHL